MLENNFELNKIFIECRYPNNLLFNDMGKLNLLKNKLSKSLPQANYDKKNNVFIMINPTKRYTCNVFEDKVILKFDEPDDINVFKNITKQVIEETGLLLDINELQRIGVRAEWGLEFQDLRTIGNIIFERFYKINEKDIQNLGIQIENPKVSFSLIKDRIKKNISIFGANVQVVEFANGIMEKNINKNMLLTDLDVYIGEKTTQKNFCKNLKALIIEQTSSIEEIKKLISVL